MKELFEIIKNLDYASTGPAVSISDIYEANEILTSNDFTKIPQDMILFLQSYNGFRTEEGIIFGIDTINHSLYDIVAENLVLPNPEPKNILILGENDNTYLAYNNLIQRYTILDKESFLELISSKSLSNLIRQILKVS